jgi:hypothetical protein
MAERLDVPARLAEGREAVQHTQTYVTACRVRGYQHPDLTAHGAQVHDWYDSEDGLDLRLLDGDCTELWAVVRVAEEALRVQRAQLDELAVAWRGPGADSAAAFLQNHCDAGEAVTTGLRSAAQACEALRDQLWHLIDEKVNAAVDIDDRTCAQRPVWLAAAHTVTAGTGDRQADDVIDQQVTPHVDNDIGVDWLTAMRTARASVAAAYDAAAGAAAPGQGIVFPIPGELGPRYGVDEPGLPAIAPVAPVTPVTSVDAPPLDLPPADPPAAQHDPVSPAAPVSPAVAPLDDPPAAPLDDAAGLPPDAGLPSDIGLPSGGLPGGGLPTGGGGFGGLIPRLADAIGGLLGSPGDGLVGEGFDEPFDDEPFNDELDDPDESDGEADEAEVDEPDESGDAELVADEPEPDPEPEQPAEDVAADAPTDDAVAVPADQQGGPAPPDAPQADGAERTPCEIAADELPQAGR